MLEPDHASLSVRRQCELLGLPRSTAYYAPIPESAENLELMREIDAVYMDEPSYGSRTIAATLQSSGWVASSCCARARAASSASR